jgi:hypothetical protein
MHKTARFLGTCLVGGLLASLAGCGQGTEVKLADVPQVQLPPTQKVEDLPKNVRSKAGSTAGLNFGPDGVVRQPPK